MKFGFVPTEGGLHYQEALEEVRLAEQAGFDSVWLSEHHLQAEHYWGSPMMALAGFATVTRRLTLGVNVAILPFYNLLRLVEDAHLLAIMSGGRFILGVGMGYRPAEYAAYGVETATRGRRYGEAIQVVRRLLRDEQVTFEGRFYQLQDVTVQPRWTAPIPFYAGGWGEQNLKRAAEQADEWIPGPTADLDKLLWCRETYARYRAEAGRPPSTEWPLTRELCIAPTEAEARQQAERYLLPNYRDEYGAWGHPLIGSAGEQDADLDAIGRNRFIVGSPEQVVEQIRFYADRLDTGHLIFRIGSTTTPHEAVMRQLELLGTTVLPRFRG